MGISRATIQNDGSLLSINCRSSSFSGGSSVIYLLLWNRLFLLLCLFCLLAFLLFSWIFLYLLGALLLGFSYIFAVCLFSLFPRLLTLFGRSLSLSCVFLCFFCFLSCFLCFCFGFFDFFGL